MNDDNSAKYDLHKSLSTFSGGYRQKYNVLEYCIPKNTFEKIYLYINVGEIVDGWEKSLHFQEESLKNEKYSDINAFIAILIMNIVAHYRHFYRAKLNTRNIVFLYFSEKEVYQKFEKIFQIIIKICNSLPKVYCINSIGKNENNFYSHMLSYINVINRDFDIKNKVKSQVHLISNNKSDYQICSLWDNIIVFKRDYGLTLLDKWNLYDTIIFRNSRRLTQNPLYLKYLDVSLCNFIAILGGSYGWKMLDSIKKIQAPQRIKMYEQFLKKQKLEADIITLDELKRFDIQFGEAMLLDDSSKREYTNRINNLRYQYNPVIRDVVKELQTVWKSKLKDSNISSINDMSQIFENNPLKIDWLMEE